MDGSLPFYLSPLRATLKLMSYTLIDSDEDIQSLLDQWKERGVRQVAMDFEGEFNLHCYGEHLCLIQIFDGEHFFLVDPLAADQEASRRSALELGKPFSPFLDSATNSRLTVEGLRLLLESPQVEKLWFDCASDGELVWKKFGIRLAGVYDLFREAKVLGLVGPGLAGNLAALTERFVKGGAQGQNAMASGEGNRGGLSKKQLQQTNWMRRPLSPPQLEYALEDVAHLFALRERLDQLAVEKKLLSQVQAAMKGVPHVRQEVVAGHTKLPGYKRLKSHQQVYLRHFFEARDTVARQLNRPPFHVLDKHLLVRLAQKAPLAAGQLQAELGGTSRSARLLLPLMVSAMEAAGQEVARMKPRSAGEGGRS